jgi:hypothetical protein
MQRGGVYAQYDHIPYRILEKARRVGAEVHTQIHLYHLVQAPFDPSSSAVEGCLRAYERFLSTSGYVPIETEMSAVHPLYRYAGTLDSVGFLNGRRSLIDLKATSIVHRESVEIQTAAYKELWDGGIFALAKLNNGRGRIAKRFVLHLKKSGVYDLIECDDIFARDRFLALI